MSNFSYLDVTRSNEDIHNINLKVGFHWQKHTNQWYMPDYSEMSVEFGPHMECGVSSGSRAEGYNIRPNNFSDYWQGSLSSWDSRPRICSLRTTQGMCDTSRPNGCVSVSEFKNQIKKIKSNIAVNNKDKIITIFAWNEWSEGAVLEESVEFGTQFLECL